MANRLYCFNLGCVVGKKCQHFLGQGKDYKGSLGYNSFPCLFLGLLHPLMWFNLIG